MPRPTLTTEPPLAPDVHEVGSSPFVIGRAVGAGARVDHPMVQPRHAILLEREDGWWISSAAPSVSVNGQLVGGRDRKLSSGDRLELAPGATMRFDDGAPAPPPRAADAPGGAAWSPPPRRRRRWRMPEFRISRGVLITLAVLIVVGGTLGYFYREMMLSKPQVEPTLTVAEAVVFDSLLSGALDHAERANVLLEVGAKDAALEEFAKGIAVITTSSLRNNAYVKRRVDQLRTSIGEGYRARSLAVPGSLAGSGRAGALAGQGLTAALSVTQFATAIDAVRSEFQQRYKIPLEVTGRDHPEHLSLYGAGGAVDLRSKSLTPTQVQFIITASQRSGVRVKDFSRDAILQAQIQAAIKAGLSDRASTGLHLHLDRFANRRDKWTVQ
jgi:hypothetical protein